MSLRLPATYVVHLDPSSPRPTRETIERLTVGDMPLKGEFVLYAHVSGQNETLYVGQTRNYYLRRQLTHANNARWWSLVALIDQAVLPDALALSTQEETLIRAWRPPFNFAANPDHPLC